MKVTVAENEEKKTKQKTNKKEKWFYLLTLPLLLSESTILNIKTFVHCWSKYLDLKVNNSWKSFKVYLWSWTPLVTHTSRSPQTSIYIRAKPRSGALVSLFSSPSLYLIKTVMKLFSTGCRRVSSRGFSRPGVGEGDEVWNLGTMFSQLARRSTRMSVSGIFK